MSYELPLPCAWHACYAVRPTQHAALSLGWVLHDVMRRCTVSWAGAGGQALLSTCRHGFMNRLWLLCNNQAGRTVAVEFAQRLQPGCPLTVCARLLPPTCPRASTLQVGCSTPNHFASRVTVPAAIRSAFLSGRLAAVLTELRGWASLPSSMAINVALRQVTACEHRQLPRSGPRSWRGASCAAEPTPRSQAAARGLSVVQDRTLTGVPQPRPPGVYDARLRGRSDS